MLDGRFDAELASDAERTQRLREAGDYDARAISREEAASVIGTAERFVAAVDGLFPG